ncbi:MAG TPA: hypothetical protein VGK00_02590 [Anaerolineales bacterium]
MKPVMIPAILTFFLLSACGPLQVTRPPDLPFLTTLTPISTTARLLMATEPASPPQPTSTEPVIATASEIPLTETPTPNPTYIAFIPTLTETLLPPLELPTEKPGAPALLAWTGLPTYPGDSDPGLLSRVDYDPDLWAQTEGNFGDVVLAHRQIDYCTITPWTGRGLPVDWKVVHEFRLIGQVYFDVNIVSAQDVVKFVTYVGGDGHLLTGYLVSFDQQQEQCIQNAEVVLGSLRSFAAIPTRTPTALPATSTP